MRNTIRLLLAAAEFALAASASQGRGTAATCERRTFETITFTVCAFDSRRDSMALVWKDGKGEALRSFARVASYLGTGLTRVQFAMNGGMFEDTGMPLGLYVEGGVMRRPLNRRRGSGNFYLKPNGVFSLDANGLMRIETTDTYSNRHTTPILATQSGPMLVINGVFHPQIGADGPSKNIRNGVGIRDPHIALFVISEEPVSFGRLARFFRDQLGCRNALYFDGAVSSLWVPSQGRQDHGAPLGPMVVVASPR